MYIPQNPWIGEIEMRAVSLEPEATATISELLQLRKDMLDSEFVMDAEAKRLLHDFNEALAGQMLRLRRDTIAMCRAAEAVATGHVTAVGRLYLGYAHAPLHPAQGEHAQQVWRLLNGTIDDYNRGYTDGIDVYRCGEGRMHSEMYTLYLDEEPGNWNEGLDCELTADMHLTYQFHHLYDHTAFSIYDLLWVRHFETEINVIRQ